MPRRTSAPQVPRGERRPRSSDLSTKRNLGLLLARLNGWNKIVFVDDDITLTRAGSLRAPGPAPRAAADRGHGLPGLPGQLRRVPRAAARQASHRTTSSPARSWASTATTCRSPSSPTSTTKTGSSSARRSARLELANVGDATQAPYKPFADPEPSTPRGVRGPARRRAVLADRRGPAASRRQKTIDSIDYRELFEFATANFGRSSSEARRETLRGNPARLSKSLATAEARQRAAVVDARAEQQLSTITPELCVAFLDAWQEDLGEWETTVEATNNVSSTWEAMNELGLRKWRLAESGDTQVAKPQRRSGALGATPSPSAGVTGAERRLMIGSRSLSS